jgi:hypothetical protein
MMSEKRVLGAKVKGGATVPKNTNTPSSFGAVWDAGGYFQPSTSNEVLTIPRPKRRGRYQIRVAVRWMNPWSIANDPPPSYDEFAKMNYYTYITINGGLLGNEARATTSPVLSASGTTQYFDTDENLSVGDSIGVKLWQSVGDDVQAFVFLEIRRLGRRVGALASPAPEPADPSADTG